MTQTLRLASMVVLLTSPLIAQSATSEYSIVELPALAAGRPSLASAINDVGQVVGSGNSSLANDHAVLWEDGNVIGLYGEFESRATDINNRRQVVGRVQLLYCAVFPGLCFRAFLWEDGTMTVLATLSPGNGEHTATAINDVGQIVGYGSTSFAGPSVAVLWQYGAITNLGTLPGATNSIATDINNLGQIIGDGGGRPFIWQNGVMSELAGLSSAWDINDRGQIVGSSGGLPVVWENGSITTLDLPPEHGPCRVWRSTSMGMSVAR